MLKSAKSTLFFVSNLKKNTIVSCVLVMCLVSFSASAGILARYSFDVDGTDDSGNGHNALIRTNASIITDAERGNVVDIPADSDVYLSDTYNNTDNWLSDSLASGQSTIMMWAKFTDWNTTAWVPALFWKGNDFQLSERNLTNTLRWTSRQTDFAAPQATYSAPINPDVADGQWHHLAGVTDAANGVLKLFIDGVEVGSTAVTTTTFVANTYPGRLGVQLAGQIDDVIFFDEALEAGAIDGSEAGTINYYRIGDDVPAPYFTPLRVGEVKPLGWMKAQMENDLERGFSYYLDHCTQVIRWDCFDTQQETPTVGGSGPGEAQGNWLDGLVRMAYLAGDTQAISKANAKLDHVLNAQDEDGYIGAYAPGNRYTLEENGELDAQARIFRALLAYYELTNDPAVLTAVEKAVQLTMSQYSPTRPYYSSLPSQAQGGACHGLVFVDVVEWLYRLTGNTDYRDYGVFLYGDYCSADVREDDNTVANLLNYNLDFQGHGAHTTDQLRIPLWVYYATGNPTYKQAYENGYDKMYRKMLPSGACIGDEGIAGDPNPDTRSTEGCTMVEQTHSLEAIVQHTGDPQYGEVLERLVFNAIQGARTNDGTAMSYCTPDNRYSATGQLGDRCKLSPAHEAPACCCPPNFTRLLPYYVGDMWMRNNIGPEGLAAVAFGPSTVTTTVNGVSVTIEEITDYPFSDTIEFKVTPASSVSFTLQFRQPDWSVDTDVVCPGATISQADGYYRVLKTWQSEDSVSVKFTPRIETVTAVDGTAALKRGVLLYALEIPDDIASVQKQYSVTHLFDTYRTPKVGTAWDYTLGVPTTEGDYGFTFVEIPDTDMDHPFTEPPSRLEGAMMKDAQWSPVSLVPFGSTVLRRLTFPVSTSATAPSTTVYSMFEEDGNFERWSVYTGITGLTINNGLLTGTTSTNTPALDRTSLSIPPEKIEKLRIRMKLSGGGGTGTANLLWKKSGESTFANSQSFSVTRDGAFHEYSIDLGSNSDWAGQTIIAVRFKVVDASGVDFDIDYILGEGRVIRDGDINEDGIVDTADFSMFMPNWLDEAYSIEGVQPPSPGPLAWYKFDETSGSTAYDSAGDYDGTTRTSYTGSTVTGNWNSNGKYGGCLEFGSHIVQIPQALGEQISDDFTITAWIKGDASSQPPSSTQTFFYANKPGDSSKLLTIYCPYTNGEVWFYSGSSGNPLKWDGAVSSDWEGGWNHYAFVKDGSDDTAYIYRNGVLVAQGTGIDTSNYWQYLTIGGKVGGSEKYVGLIDEFKIYDRALDQSEIIGDMQQSSTTDPVEPGTPVVWWPLDETEGPYAYDASGHGFMGIVTTKLTSYGGTLISDGWQPDGKLGGCLGLTGGSGAYGIQMPPGIFSSIGNQFTLSLWLRGNLGAQPPVLPWVQVLFYASGSAGAMEIQCPSTSSEVTFGTFSGEALNWASSESDWEGQWNHYVFVKDASAGTMKIYRNGELVASRDNASTSLSGITTALLGIRPGGAGGYVGLIDDVRIYDYALSDQEVLWLSRKAEVNQSVLQPGADLNLDGAINLSDFALFGTNWLEW